MGSDRILHTQKLLQQIMLVKICDFEAMFSYFEIWVSPEKFRNSYTRLIFVKEKSLASSN